MVLLIMGVSGSGKTTVGSLVARTLNVPFLDADDLHSPANIIKMKKGIPLSDTDREPWLIRIAEKICQMARSGGGVVACSALKEAYRKILFEGLFEKPLVVYLKGDRSILEKRMAGRKDHFMPAALLQSQLNTLEEPENAMTLDILLSPETLCQRIVHYASKHLFQPNDLVGR